MWRVCHKHSVEKECPLCIKKLNEYYLMNVWISPRAQAVTARTYLRPDPNNNNFLEAFKDQQHRATVKHHEMLLNLIIDT